MLFNSIEFAVFFPLVFIGYWFVVNRNLKLQNLFILAASFLFYGWWNWRFLALLASGCIINYFIGIGLTNLQNKAKRRLLLWVALIYNLGLLVVFKYLDFFIESFSTAFTFLGGNISSGSLNIVLPVGISFYTFQALGYIIEVYRKNVTPARDFISFSAFVSFFPLILAGPIERATHLLPQFYGKRTFEYSKATDGLRQILWGLFKKIVIADNCAEYANIIFNNAADYSGSSLVLGALFYTVQIYADFSGYSDIAIGVSRLLGFDIIRNFNNPYFSLNVADFWRRWHIALSSWFRDYLFTPLSIKIRNWGTTGVVFSFFVTFLLCGLWHGANYTFIVWGGLHGLALGWDVFSFRTRKKVKRKMNPALYNFFSWCITMVFIVFTWIFFRAENLHQAINYVSGIFSNSLFSIPYIIEEETGLPILPKLFILLLCGFIIVEWIGRKQQHILAYIDLKWKKLPRYALYYAMILLILWYGGKEQQFIYFQF